MIINTDELLKKKSLNRFQLVRKLFIIGFILNIILTFVPTISYQPYSFYEQPIKYLSNYEAIQLLLKAQSFWGFYYVFLFFLNIVFIFLAIKYPNRWVFIAGATITVFNYLLILFSPSGNNNWHYVLITTVFQYLASFFIFCGFFAYPPIIQQTVSK